MENQTKTIKLIGGYIDKKGVVHRDVTFSKRLRLKNLIDLDSNPLAGVPVQRELLLLAASITAFGSLKIPVTLPVLFELDSIDADDLQVAHDEFLQMTREDKKGEILSDNQTRLAFGVEQDGVNYDLVTFGKRLTNKDRAEAQRKGLSGVGRMLHETVVQIEKIAHEESGLELTAPFKSGLFENLDLEDFDVLFAGGERWRQSFRGNGGDSLEDGRETGADSGGENDGNESSGSGSVAG